MLEGEVDATALGGARMGEERLQAAGKARPGLQELEESVLKMLRTL